MILALALTEAELAELETAHRRSLEGADPDGRDARAAPAAPVTETRAEARRSLIVRGLLTADGRLDVGDEASEAALVVRTALDVRACASRTLVLDRLVATDGREEPEHGVEHVATLVHLLDGAACLEDVTDTGAHRLWLLLDPLDVGPLVAVLTVPEDAIPGTGAVRRGPPDRPHALGAVLDHPSTLAALALLDHDGQVLEEHLLALGPRGCWRAPLGPRAASGDDLDFQPAEPAWLEGWVRDVQQAAEAVEATRWRGTMAG